MHCQSDGWVCTAHRTQVQHSELNTPCCTPAQAMMQSGMQHMLFMSVRQVRSSRFVLEPCAQQGPGTTGDANNLHLPVLQSWLSHHQGSVSTLPQRAAAGDHVDL